MTHGYAALSRPLRTLLDRKAGGESDPLAPLRAIRPGGAFGSTFDAAELADSIESEIGDRIAGLDDLALTIADELAQRADKGADDLAAIAGSMDADEQEDRIAELGMVEHDLRALADAIREAAESVEWQADKLRDTAIVPLQLALHDLDL